MGITQKELNMKQPQLGLKVVDLRQQKGLTQEKLAELCEVSTRTIQRIESGEVDPRSYTLQCLGTALGYDFSDENSGKENFWLAVLHLSSALCLLLIPILLWSWKKDQSHKIGEQGRQVLNFQVTMTLLLFASLLLLMVLPAALTLLEKAGLINVGANPMIIAYTLFAPLPLILLGIFCTFQGVINAIRALSDKPIHYSFSIPFVRN
jgi:uncharacterized Tic20 family protein/DNA-binding XRE family transcriptional regulator